MHSTRMSEIFHTILRYRDIQATTIIFQTKTQLTYTLVAQAQLFLSIFLYLTLYMFIGAQSMGSVVTTFKNHVELRQIRV